MTNPGAGAWRAEIYKGHTEDTELFKKYNKFYKKTTANFLELNAIVEATKIVDPKIRLTIVHKSKYIDDIITKWIFQWEKRDFRTSNKEKLANHDEIVKLNDIINNHNVRFIYTGRHTPIYISICQLRAKEFLYRSIEKSSPIKIIETLIKNKK